MPTQIFFVCLQSGKSHIKTVLLELSGCSKAFVRPIYKVWDNFSDTKFVLKDTVSSLNMQILWWLKFMSPFSRSPRISPSRSKLIIALSNHSYQRLVTSYELLKKRGKRVNDDKGLWKTYFGFSKVLSPCPKGYISSLNAIMTRQ